VQKFLQKFLQNGKNICPVTRTEMMMNEIPPSSGLPDVFKQKIQIWVNFGGPWKEKSWYILWSFGI
jgi:hypothetical protein